MDIFNDNDSKTKVALKTVGLWCVSAALGVIPLLVFAVN